MSKSNLEKTYGIDPLIPTVVLMVLFAAGLFGFVAFCAHRDNSLKAKVNPPPVTEIKLYDFSSGPESPTTKVLQAGNQNPDGSVDIKVRMSDLKIRGMGLGPTNQ